MTVGNAITTFPLFTEDRATFRRWFDLVRRYGVQGKQVHDTRLVAVLLENGGTHILTLNVADFLRFQPEGVSVVHPGSV